jgi:hypothetical protein
MKRGNKKPKLNEFPQKQVELSNRLGSLGANLQLMSNYVIGDMERDRALKNGLANLQKKQKAFNDDWVKHLDEFNAIHREFNTLVNKIARL